jgi:hypothetical protein
VDGGGKRKEDGGGKALWVRSKLTIFRSLYFFGSQPE